MPLCGRFNVVRWGHSSGCWVPGLLSPRDAGHGGPLPRRVARVTEHEHAIEEFHFEKMIVQMYLGAPSFGPGCDSLRPRAPANPSRRQTRQERRPQARRRPTMSAQPSHATHLGHALTFESNHQTVSSDA